MTAGCASDEAAAQFPRSFAAEWDMLPARSKIKNPALSRQRAARQGRGTIRSQVFGTSGIRALPDLRAGYSRGLHPFRERRKDGQPALAE